MDATVSTCFRHPEVETPVHCARCRRPVCPDCVREAADGPRCVECSAEDEGAAQRQPGTAFGGGGLPVAVVTYALIGLNLLFFLGELVRPEILDQFGMLGAGMRGPDGEHYVHQDPVPPGFTAEGVVAGEWYRLLTGAFLHLSPTEGLFGILHIGLNMFSLWNIGRVVELQLGRVRYLALYLLSALGSSVLVLLLAPDTDTVGASGAIFGLGAACYVVGRRLGAPREAVNRMLGGLLVWMLVSAGFASWQGHLGGLLTGALVAAAFAWAPRARRLPVQGAACAIVLLVLLVLAAVKVSSLTGSGAA
ncbi:rhomboid family intramembrane serine protease [Streptomyces sp. SCSIO ZS0520]|uniref:rhomboid family intramembrane serine protease n=1 Tax=Streptomyces sp. SCSIO ZS0520 TaxID=2892996 RepID=UPI0021DAB58E|nr:rhomboid family intramembrane serine protease [Streptomyces sp. SCSIO ZS0520]